MADDVSIERALAAIREVAELQSQMTGVLTVLKNLSDRVEALESANKTSAKPQ